MYVLNAIYGTSYIRILRCLIFNEFLKTILRVRESLIIYFSHKLLSIALCMTVLSCLQK